MLRIQLVATALALTTLAASGCGGSSKSTQSKSAQLTSAELIAKADAICARIHAKYPANWSSTNSDIARYAPRVAAYEQMEVEELRDLPAPKSMASDWNLFGDNTQTITNDTVNLGEYIKENNLKAATALLSADRLLRQQTLAVVARDGFKECAQTL